MEGVENGRLDDIVDIWLVAECKRLKCGRGKKELVIFVNGGE